VASGELRLRLVTILAEGRDRIVKQAAGKLFQNRADLVSSGGNAYGETMTALCLRDMDYLVKPLPLGASTIHTLHGLNYAEQATSLQLITMPESEILMTWSRGRCLIC